ncbi:TPA: SDR family oxidoreductase, partial [Burkholderia cenocepacia]
RPARPRDDNALYDSRHALHEREGMEGPVLRSCAYNTVVQRPKVAGAVALGAAALVFAAFARARRSSA